MMYRRDESGNVRAYDRDWANNEWNERTYPVDKKDPCASDSTLSGCGGYKKDSVIDNKLDYGLIGRNIDHLNEGTIEIIKLVEKQGFNEYGNFIVKDTIKFLEKYGRHLPVIIKELRELNIGYLFYSYYGSLKMIKLDLNIIKNNSVSIYYDSIESKNNKFLQDVIEMSKSGLHINEFLQVTETVRHGTGFNEWTETISRGYIAEFRKD